MASRSATREFSARRAGTITAAGLVLAASFAIGCCGSAAAAELIVSGVHPDRRPEGAPTITQPPKGAEWDARYLHGVVKPAPAHLGLEDQGAWYTPFNHRGMTPPYDPRGWWSAPPRKSAGN